MTDTLTLPDSPGASPRQLWPTHSRITDNRTGKSYELPIADGTIKATDLRQIRTSDDDFGLMTYDPAFMNTASCRSAITYIDGDKGILRYRGYPIEQLAENGQLPRGRLPAVRRRAAQPGAAGQVGDRHPVPHLRPHQRHQVPRGLPLRRAPDGDAARRGRGALDLLSGRQAHRGPGEPLHPAGPADGQAADHRGLRLPAHPRPALRVPAERPRTTSGTSST